MLHVASSCPICGQGTIGFRLCSDAATVVLMCDECQAVWLDPSAVDAAGARYPTPPDFIVPGLGCAVDQLASRWASRGEVERAGWQQHIAGSATPADRR